MRSSRWRLAVTLTALLASAACATDAIETDPLAESVSFENIPFGDAREMPASGPFAEGRLGPAGGTIFVPSSATLVDAVVYRFSLGHCGLLSPVDLDGSFWDPIEGVGPNGQPLDLESDGEMINATSGVIVVIGDEARFRTDSGSVIRLSRHDGEMEFPACA